MTLSRRYTVLAVYLQYDEEGLPLDIFISNASEVPIYQQIVEQIQRLILSGALEAGEALPSMRLLAKELRISVITTKRAYDELERAGFLENVAGKGCFVAAQSPGLLREARLRMAEEHLRKAVDVARTGAISLEELTELLALIYREEM